MGQKLKEDELDELTEIMIGYDCCHICKGIEDGGEQKEITEDSGITICDECLEEVPGFVEWFEDGNVVELEFNVYATQDAQYRNKLKGVEELVNYFKKEFLIN
jgi:hypothetical protein